MWHHKQMEPITVQLHDRLEGVAVAGVGAFCNLAFLSNLQVNALTLDSSIMEPHWPSSLSTRAPSHPLPACPPGGGGNQYIYIYIYILYIL